MRVLIAVAAAALLIAGCGGGDPAAPASSGVDAGAPSAAAPSRDSGVTVLLTSSAFGYGERIPERFTCRGAGEAPDLTWTDVPAEATSVALVVNDPDAGSGGFLHWVLYDLPAGDGSLAGDKPPPGAHEAENSGGRTGWTPPCPPSGTHHYIFTLYALARTPAGDSARDIVADLEQHFLAKTQLVGLVSAP